MGIAIVVGRKECEVTVDRDHWIKNNIIAKPFCDLSYVRSKISQTDQKAKSTVPYNYVIVVQGWGTNLVPF